MNEVLGLVAVLALVVIPWDWISPVGDDVRSLAELSEIEHLDAESTDASGADKPSA